MFISLEFIVSVLVVVEFIVAVFISLEFIVSVSKLLEFMVSVFISTFFAPLVFFGGFYGSLAGMALWGVGMGAQESIMRAAVAGMVSSNKRGTAYGIFNTGYGVLWFVGSALMGIFYDFSIPLLVAFSMATQMVSIALLFQVKRISKPTS